MAISKAIQKEIKAFQRARRRDEIQRILDEGKSLQALTQQSNLQKKHMISSMKDCAGIIKTKKKDVANVFADFYEELYSRTNEQSSGVCEEGDMDHAIPCFSFNELESQIRALKRGKARDRSGIVAEMLKHSGASIKIAVLEMFNSILRRDTKHPTNWATTTISVIYKKR